MITQATPSRTILEVERAISDLRRGQAVLLTQAGKPSLAVASGEHNPKEAAAGDAAHPAVQLMKLAGLLPQAVICDEGISDGLLAVSAEAIAHYPAELASALEKVSEAYVPLKGGQVARIIAYRPRFGHEEHLAVVIGDPASQDAAYVRIHSSCFTGDVFGSLRCDCGGQLEHALELIREQGAGIVLYLSQEGRGIGIANKLRAYALQDRGMDTVEANEALGFAADERDFALAATMLNRLGIRRIALLTNNPHKADILTKRNIEIAKRVPVVIKPNAHNERYLETKVQKLGHQF